MERKPISHITDVFVAFGRTADLAEAIDQPLWRVEKWRQRGRIPPEYWEGICRAAPKDLETEVSLELLMRLHASPTPTKAVRGRVAAR